MTYPEAVIAAGKDAMRVYAAALPYGQRWAEMCALGVAPGTKGTDRAFMQGRMNNQQLDAMPKAQAAWLSREAREAGINISGKYYCGGIADSRGWRDPEAWVSSNDDVRRVAASRNLHVTGSVEHAGRPEPPKRTVISESSVREAVRRELKKNPRAKVGEVREKVIEKHSYRRKM